MRCHSPQVGRDRRRRVGWHGIRAPKRIRVTRTRALFAFSCPCPRGPGTAAPGLRLMHANTTTVQVKSPCPIHCVHIHVRARRPAPDQRPDPSQVRGRCPTRNIRIRTRGPTCCTVTVRRCKASVDSMHGVLSWWVAAVPSCWRASFQPGGGGGSMALFATAATLLVLPYNAGSFVAVGRVVDGALEIRATLGMSSPCSLRWCGLAAARL